MTTSCHADLSARGFLYQTTGDAELQALLDGAPCAFYMGFDPTAPSLHVGHLLPIMAARRLQAAGHRAIMLVGGATALVGDPSGKSEARPILSKEEVASNAESIKAQISRFVDFSSGRAELVNNADWLSGVTYLDMLRDVGRHFSVSRMLSMDSVRLRMEAGGISFLEFNYMVLQAYDFLVLHRTRHCVLQAGGQDQWGNIVAGVELVRRVARAAVHGVTFPLLTDSSGQKFGKTAAGAVFLDPARTSIFDYYQFWRNTADSDVGRLLKLFTPLPVAECDRLAALSPPSLNRAKEILAFEATRLAHGAAEAANAYAAAGAKFGFADPQGAIPTSSALAAVPAAAQADNLPTLALPATRLAEGVWIVAALVEAGLAASNGEARRLIQGGGAYLNDVKISDMDFRITQSHLSSGAAILRAGKKQVRRLVSQG